MTRRLLVIVAMAAVTLIGSSADASAANVACLHYHPVLGVCLDVSR